MGVGFMVGGHSVGAGWSYSGFGVFRTALAKLAGIELEKMAGFHGKISWDSITDPIKPLLNHSDCDDTLSPEECAKVAPRLRELIAVWEDKVVLDVNPEFRKLDNYDKVNALKLADGMDLAVKTNQPLEFC